jgi:hypothetical protein
MNCFSRKKYSRCYIAYAIFISRAVQDAPGKLIVIRRQAATQAVVPAKVVSSGGRGEWRKDSISHAGISPYAVSHLGRDGGTAWLPF